MIGDFLFLSRVKRKLRDDTISPLQVFIYFLTITAFDGLQLAILQVSPPTPTSYTPITAWGSAIIALFFLILSFIFNGGRRGRHFLDRWFCLCGVIGLWVIIPFQCLLAAPTYIESIAKLEWYAPTVILIANFAVFLTVAMQFREIASGPDIKNVNE